MKRIIIIFLSALGVIAVSCTDSDPVTLSFENVYGRPGWDLENPDTSKYYYIYSARDLTYDPVEGTGAEGYVYKIRTTGGDPSVTTQRLLKSTGGSVLQFEYKSSKRIVPYLKLDVRDPDTQSKMWEMLPVSDWTEYTFDLSIISAVAGWGSEGSSLTIVFGDEPGVDIEIRNIEVRQPVTPELKKRESFYWTFDRANTNSGLDACYVITDPEMKTYATQTYELHPRSTATFCRMVTDPRWREIFEEENQIYFEYKCDKPVAIDIYWRWIGLYNTGQVPLEPTSEWKEAYIDASAVTAYIFDPAVNIGGIAGAQNSEGGFDLYWGDENATFYIRGLRTETR